MTLKKFIKTIKEEGDFYCFEYNKYICYVIRHNINKSLNGYVQIPTNHKYYNINSFEESSIICYGGITFVQSCNDKMNGFIIGFNTSHTEDLSILDAPLFKRHILYKTYKNKEFVISECKSICDQLDMVEHFGRKRKIQELIYN